MTRQQSGGTAPELVALRRFDEARNRRIVGWAMLVAERVVVYVPEHPRVAGGTLLNSYSSLDSADRLLAHAGIHSVREWPPLLGESLTEQQPANP